MFGESRKVDPPEGLEPRTRWRKVTVWLLAATMLVFICQVIGTGASLARAKPIKTLPASIRAQSAADYSADAQPGDVPQVNQSILIDLIQDVPATIQAGDRLGTLEARLQTPVPTMTLDRSESLTPSPTWTAAIIEIPTRTSELTETNTSTTGPSPTSTGTPTFTSTQTFTRTGTRTYTPTTTQTSTANISTTFTGTPTRTSTRTFTYTPATAYSPTRTYTRPSSASPTRTFTLLYTNTFTPTRTNTRTSTASATRTFTHTSTTSPTRTHTPVFTLTFTTTASPTRTNTRTSTHTASPTYTHSPTFTDTPISAPTNTFTRTNTATFTATDTPTPTSTFTFTHTPTDVSTFTPTFTPTDTLTPTDTPTDTLIPTDTPLYSPTSTISSGCVGYPSGGFTASQDTYVDKTQQDTALGSDATIIIRPTAGVDLRGLVAFDLSSIPAGSTVHSAYLYLTIITGKTYTVEFYPVTAAWDETVTWNTMPGSDASSKGSLTLSTTACTRVAIFDTALVQAWVDGTASNYGIYLYPPAGSGQSVFSSREGSNPPVMVVDYSMP